MTDEKFPPEKNLPTGYVPPKVWTWEAGNGGQFASINRPTAGAQTEVELKVGKHPLQLYSLGTPNGQKVTILLEELLAAGHSGAEYDAWLINIGKGDQFGSGFVGINPNSKIPALADHAPKDGGKPIRLFESASIMTYLAEKFGAFLPSETRARAEAFNWLFWQMGSAPFVGGGFGHFFSYAPVKIQYAIDRYAMETKRQLDVLNRQLAENEFVSGSEYTIADMAIWPWYGRLALDQSYPDAGTFLQTQDYAHVLRWAKQLAARPAVQRGSIVNKTSGPLSEQLHERHDASDFDTKTQDKIAAAYGETMPSLPDMTKHRGFPGGMPGTGVQFTIRRANPRGVTPIKALPRKARPGTKEHRIDAAFLHALWHHFGAEPFERGNLDAARLSLLFGREVIPATKDFDPLSYEAMLVIDEKVARKNFPESFEDVFEV